jgi:hypothetical protein
MMRCSALAAQFTLCHDILKGILRRAVHRAGMATALEQPVCRLPGLTARAGTSDKGSAIRPGAQGGILLSLPQGISITYISVIHPLSIKIISWALPRLEPRHSTVTSGRGRPMREWSRMAKASYPSLWRRTVA